MSNKVTKEVNEEAVGNGDALRLRREHMQMIQL